MSPGEAQAAHHHPNERGYGRVLSVIPVWMYLIAGHYPVIADARFAGSGTILTGSD
jgi:hypothetical protein